jgi:hypothetical protein
LHDALSLKEQAKIINQFIDVFTVQLDNNQKERHKHE